MTGPGDDLPPHPVLAGGPVYLDYNATTPVDPRVAAAMLPHLTGFFGNPSSSHPYADAPRRALAEARAQVAGLIGARPGEVVLTSSGSEADLLALRGAVLASGRPRPHVITQATEHPGRPGNLPCPEAAARHAGGGQAPRTPPWPSRSAPPRSSRPTSSPPVPRPVSRPCATTCTSGRRWLCRAGSA